MNLSMSTFRVFVSSTFTDLKAERNALQEIVFPRLKELCLQNGCRFQTIDLRWGVSEEASLDQQAMKVCLDELKRCQEITPRPNFIVLLGDRYGWRPLPHEIPAIEFEEILKQISPEEIELLYWKEDQALDNKGWYRRDDNSVPPVYCLQPRAGPWKDPVAWSSLESILRQVLLKGLEGLAFSSADHRRYFASATAQEIEAGALDKHELKGAGEHVYCFCRTIEELASEPTMSDPEEIRLASEYIDFKDNGEIDHQAQRSLDCLRDRIVSHLRKNVFFYDALWLGQKSGNESPITTQHLDQLCRDAYQALSQVILEQISLLKKISTQEQEKEAHKSFARNHSSLFLGRRGTITAIMDYLAGDVPRPIAVFGPMGSGKSALLAKCFESVLRQQPNATILTRFIGSTPTSSSGIALIQHICQELGTEISISAGFSELAQAFSQCLDKASPNKPIILLIDGIDQLAPGDPANKMVWLPARLPPYVRLVVSCQTQSNAAKILQKRLPSDHVLHLPFLAPSETCEILALWLEGACRTLTQTQWMNVVYVSRSQGTPLFLKLAYEEARRWKSFTPAITMPSDTSGLVRYLFTRLSRDDHHGRLLVSRSLGYLAAARNGLSEDELLEVLSQDEDVLGDFYRRSHHDPPQPHLPVVVWSRLHTDLEPYLALRRVDNVDLLVFFHRQLGEEAAALFLPPPEKLRRHRCLAAFFRSQPLKWPKGDQNLPNFRCLSELPHQQIWGELRSELLETLTTPDFVETKAHAGLSYDLLADLNQALHHWDCSTLSQLHKALMQAIPWMAKRPELALQFYFNRLNWSGPIPPSLRAVLTRWETNLDRRNFWLKAAAPIPRAGTNTGTHFTLVNPTIIQALAFDGKNLAAATAEGAIELRDTTQGSIVDQRRLTASGIVAIALREDLTVAYLTNSGSIGVEANGEVFAGRAGETVLATHPRHGILGMNQMHSLVAWNPERNTVTPLAENLPQPLVALRLTLTGELALFVAGRRPQVVGFSRYDGNAWQAVTFNSQSAPVVDADIDPIGQQALLLCLDRSLRLLKTEDPGIPVAILRYEARPGGFQGQPRKARFGIGESSNGWAFFATEAGHIGSWHWADGFLKRLASFRRSVTDPAVLRIFEVMPDSGNLLYSTETLARAISPSDSYQFSEGHLAPVSDCKVTDTETVATLSEQEQTVRWFTVNGLSPLACQPSRSPTTMAVKPGGDEVLLGDSRGRFWVQPPHRSSIDQEQVQVMNERLVSLVPINTYQVLAAGESGQIMKLDQKKKKFDLVYSGDGFREHFMTLPAGTIGVCWSLFREEMGNKPLTVSVVNRRGREKILLKTAGVSVHYGAAVSEDGRWLALAGMDVKIYRAVRRGLWREPELVLHCSRETHVSHVAFLRQGKFLAVTYTGKPWVEVWAVQKELPTVAVAELPGSASSIGSKGSNLIVGFESGELMSLVLTGIHKC